MRADYKIFALLLLAAVVSYVVCDDVDDEEELSVGSYNNYANYGKHSVGYGTYVPRYRSAGYAGRSYGGYRSGRSGYGYGNNYGGRYGYGHDVYWTVDQGIIMCCLNEWKKCGKIFIKI